MSHSPAVLGHVIGRPGGPRLEILEHGARVRRLDIPVDGGARNVALGYRTLDDYVSGGTFFGATIGRYANRIADGDLTVEGRRFRLGRNNGAHTLHGGPGGFDTRVWQTTDLGPEHVTLGLLSPDGDQGFPGDVTAQVTYRVRDDGVDIDLAATTDAPTVVNLTNHTWFNLAGEGSRSADDHRLTLPADRVVVTDQTLVPTGELADVGGTPFDFRSPRRIGEAVRDADARLGGGARGIDHHFVVPGSGDRELARLAVDDLELVLTSDAPGLQVYTGNFLDGLDIGTSGRRYRQGDGIALEPQMPPDTPHHPEFGSATLRPGETHRRRIGWTFRAN